jgi:carboxymethylenebutenolidase
VLEDRAPAPQKEQCRMCDEHFEEDLANYMRHPPLTRRQFGALSIGAGVTVLLPRAADALDVKESEVNVKTPDGVADCYFVHPATGASAGVVVWPDILGLRPAFRQMGKRLAESGYAVLVVNPFYRQKKAPVVPPGANFADQATRDIVMPLAQGLSPTTHGTDARAFVAFLDSQPAVDRNRKVGTTGYCMGGPIVMRTAAAVPDRVGAGATFHGGGLVTKEADSPHLLIPNMKAQFLCAVAANDDEREPDAKNVLRDTFAKAKLPAEIEVYTGAAHGWCPPDSAVYNEKQAERAWARLLVLFKSALA